MRGGLLLDGLLLEPSNGRMRGFDTSLLGCTRGERTTMSGGGGTRGVELWTRSDTGRRGQYGDDAGLDLSGELAVGFEFLGNPVDHPGGTQDKGRPGSLPGNGAESLADTN